VLPLLTATALFPYIAIVLGASVKTLTGLRHWSWHSLSREEHKLGPTRSRLQRHDSGNMKRASGERALLAGEPIGWQAAGFEQSLTHLPLYWRAVFVGLLRLFSMIFTSIRSVIRGGDWIPDTTEAKIYNIAITSPFILIAKHDPELKRLSLKIPQSIPCEWLNGDSPRGLELLFDCEKQSIIRLGCRVTALAHTRTKTQKNN